MVTLPPAEWRERAGLAALVGALGGPDVTRLVGGAVRDGLLGLPVSDIDIATRLPPQTVLERLAEAGIKGVPTGLAHGTVTAVTAGGPVEVTTLRRDVATDGRHATVAFGAEWREDAGRRDFTINALYADPASGDVSDWFDGVADLAAGVVRFIGDPLQRIAEDHLRILRFYRFHARFGRGQPEAAGTAACVARANDLMALSRERIAAELLKLLADEDPAPTVAAMLAGGILKPVLPELTSAEALGRLVGRERGLVVPGDPIRRLAALIGSDPDTAAAIAARLKLSNARARRLTLACGWSNGGAARALAYRFGLDTAIDRLLLRDASESEVHDLGGWRVPVLPIGGGALVQRGLTPGPLVARTLGAIEADWIEQGFPRGPAFEALVARHLPGPTGAG